MHIQFNTLSDIVLWPGLLPGFSTHQVSKSQSAWPRCVSTFYLQVSCSKFRPHLIKPMLGSMVRFLARPQNQVYLTQMKANDSTNKKKTNQWDWTRGTNRIDDSRRKEFQLPREIFQVSLTPLSLSSRDPSNTPVFSFWETCDAAAPPPRTLLPTPALHTQFFTPPNYPPPIAEFLYPFFSIDITLAMQ